MPHNVPNAPKQTHKCIHTHHTFAVQYPRTLIQSSLNYCAKVLTYEWSVSSAASDLPKSSAGSIYRPKKNAHSGGKCLYLKFSSCFILCLLAFFIFLCSLLLPGWFLENFTQLFILCCFNENFKAPLGFLFLPQVFPYPASHCASIFYCIPLSSMDSSGPLPLGWIPYERFLIFLLISEKDNITPLFISCLSMKKIFCTLPLKRYT